MRGNPLGTELRFLAAVRVRDDLAYGVFTAVRMGLPPTAAERMRLGVPGAMTFVADGDGWAAYLDGALRVQALNVFAPGES